MHFFLQVNISKVIKRVGLRSLEAQKRSVLVVREYSSIAATNSQTFCGWGSVIFVTNYSLMVPCLPRG
ncbi:MAG: hypothetical protein LBF72_01065 [Holosporales bacterium]|nr:hypothetical protein [Holosporales bacterium]